MRQFDFFEFTELLAPGAVVLLSFVLISPAAFKWLETSNLSIGDLGIFVVLAYVVGHLVQAGGNLLEQVWWYRRGMPSDWVRAQSGRLLAEEQEHALDRRVRDVLDLPDLRPLPALSATAWAGLTRQVYTVVRSGGCNARVDVFNGTYGLLRGLVVAFISVFILSLVATGFDHLPAKLALLVAAGLAGWRMERFARLYAAELFTQFLQLRKEGAAPSAPPAGETKEE